MHLCFEGAFVEVGFKENEKDKQIFGVQSAILTHGPHVDEQSRHQ